MIKFKKTVKSKKWLNWTNDHLKDKINKIYFYFKKYLKDKIEK